MKNLNFIYIIGEIKKKYVQKSPNKLLLSKIDLAKKKKILSSLTEGWINGEGDLLSADRSVIMLKLSGLELSIKSGETHRMIGLGFGGTTRQAKIM